MTNEFASSDPQSNPGVNDGAVEGGDNPTSGVTATETRLASLQRQEADLKQRLADLQATYERQAKRQFQDIQADLSRLVREGLRELETRKQALQTEIDQLERRQERIRAEMRTSFAGASQDLAIRVKGFKDYLVGSLQDLVSATEQLNLVPPTAAVQAPPLAPPPVQPAPDTAAMPTFAPSRFADQTERIRSLLDQYRLRPDYYGPVWQLRRTFEPIHAEKVAYWFFTHAGRGAIKSMGSRLQNVLIASAAISILNSLYGERVRVLVLSNTPERLGEWRRGLQDCLGLSRAEFGANRGVVLFEAPEPLAQRAERLLEAGQLPVIIIDEAEEVISLSLLQFPLWLAFAPDPMKPMPDYDYY